MDEKIIFEKDSSSVKKSFHVLLLYASRYVKIEPMKFKKLTQKYLHLYIKMYMDFLHQNLERTK